MTLGEKIRISRKNIKMSQSELCGTKITRNMLSAVENDKATPSLDTLRYIASRLSVPLPYLVSEDDDAFFYRKRAEMRYITAAFRAKRYKECIDHINKIEGTDDELVYLLACCHFELGRTSLFHGSLTSSAIHLNKAREYCEKTIYDTQRIKNRLPLYIALAANIQAPMLELDENMFNSESEAVYETEFYHYVSGDLNFKYTISDFAKHVSAKSLIKDRDYFSAVTLMREIENEKNAKTYNACVIFGIYTDMESCYRQLGDFENAYRYSNKRISMIEGFKS